MSPSDPTAQPANHAGPLAAEVGSARPEDDAAAAKVAAVTAALWERSRDRFAAQAERLDRIVLALVEGTLQEEERSAGAREAHQLAGTAGMFGLWRASHAARELEQILSPGGGGPADAARAAELVQALELDISAAVRPAAAPVSEPPAAAPAVLLVSRDRQRADLLAHAAEQVGLAVRQASGPLDAVEALDAVNAVALDLAGGGLDEESLALLRRLRSAAAPAVVLLGSDRLSTADRVTAGRLGVRGFLDSELTPDDVAVALCEVMGVPGGSGGTLLVVDDDAVVLDALRDALTRERFRVETLRDPMRFWEVLAQVQPDLVVLDVDMPEVDGIELCRLLRADSRYSWLPVLVLSGLPYEATAKRALAAGADDFVSKAVELGSLAPRLADRLRRTRKAARAAPGATLHPLPATRSGGVDVTVVEDDEVLAELLRHSVEGAGLTCSVIHDGLRAQRQLAGGEGSVPTRVVLLDLNLPSRGGIEVLRSMREAGVLERTSVVVLTARATEADKLLALREGAVDHISKPFSVPVLLAKLQRLFET